MNAENFFDPRKVAVPEQQIDFLNKVLAADIKRNLAFALDVEKGEDIDFDLDSVFDVGNLVKFQRILNLIKSGGGEVAVEGVGRKGLCSLGKSAEMTAYPKHRLSMFSTLMMHFFFARKSGSGWKLDPTRGSCRLIVICA